MKVFTETRRLIFREIVLADADAMYELDGDPEVHRYLGNKPVLHRDQTKEVIKSIRQQYQEFGIGRWAIIEKSTNQFLGWAGLKFNTCVINNQINYHDMGYRLIRKYWGQGYATESALAAVAYGFEIMKLEKLTAAAHVENIASNRIIAKAGLIFVNQFSYDHSLHNWYEVSRDEWIHTR